MGWGRMDDGFDDHPKVVALLDTDDPASAGVAIGLWTLAWTWAHRNTRKRGKTPGLIPPGLPRRFLGTVGRPAADLLVAHKLWDTHDGGGWLIHDFGDYLPTEETRAARSEAGKRGAAARWGNRDDDEDAGIDPYSDGNLPSVCHNEDGNGEANDGSRAPAHRVPTPTPTPNTEPPAEVLFDTTPPTSSPAKPKRATKAATRIPDDFAVTPEMVAWAGEHTPLVDGKWQTEQFIDHWQAATRNATKKDWVAAWRTWMRNAQEKSERYAPRVPAQQDPRREYPAGYESRGTVALADRQNGPRESAQVRKAREYLEIGADLDAEFANGGRL
jgi:hypothetical protein